MKKYIKYFIIVIAIVFVCVIIAILYQKNNEMKIIESKRQAVELDEKEYEGKYQSFNNEQYKEKPQRIVFKKENSINELKGR
ncbi:MAG: hypothetical protein J6A36_04265 [Clostridia bacterium]|nr:hypothetical protein [Clostridia bacterium]